MRAPAKRSNYFIWLAAGIILSGLTVASAQQADVLKAIELDSSNAKSEITAAVGQKIIIKMAASVRNDCRWAIKTIENGSLKVVKKEYVKDKQNKMLAYSIMTLKGVKAGESKVTLSLTCKSDDGRRLVGNNTFKINVLTIAAYHKLGPQGVNGSVLKLTGSQMPGPGRPPAGSGGSPLSVPVHIFRDDVEVIQKPDPNHKQLVKIVKSGKDGSFKVDLPPGRYTAVAVINGRMYLNNFTSANTWGTFSVFKGNYTAITIKDTSGAAF
jgi:hypothetical protein